jgi:hypothetical protein
MKYKVGDKFVRKSGVEPDQILTLVKISGGFCWYTDSKYVRSPEKCTMDVFQSCMDADWRLANKRRNLPDWF